MSSFKNLKIDYLSLNLQFRNIKKIANFLANLGCKSTLVDESKRKSYVLTKIHKHRYSAEFVVNLNKYWKGTTQRFKGKNAKQFYNDLRLQKLDPKSDRFGNWVTAVFRQSEVLEDEKCTEQEVKYYV